MGVVVVVLVGVVVSDVAVVAVVVTVVVVVAVVVAVLVMVVVTVEVGVVIVQLLNVPSKYESIAADSDETVGSSLQLFSFRNPPT